MNPLVANGAVAVDRVDSKSPKYSDRYGIDRPPTLIDSVERIWGNLLSFNGSSKLLQSIMYRFEVPQPVYSELPTLWRAKLLLKKKNSESDYTANYRVRGVWNIKNIIDAATFRWLR